MIAGSPGAQPQPGATAVRPRIIGWGTPRHLPFLLIQASAPIEAVIDGLLPAGAGGSCVGVPIVPPDYLRQCPPAATRIILLAQGAHHPAIRERIRQYGPFAIQDADSFFTHWRRPEDICETLSMPPEAWEARLNSFLQAARQEAARAALPGRACLWLHGLCNGGAERQMVLLARGLRRLGWEVDFITQSGDVAATAPWAEELLAAGVSRFPLPDSVAARDVLWPHLVPGSRALALAGKLTELFSAEALFPIFSTYAVLRQRRPEILVSYLDNGNLIAALAAVMAGVSRVVMSGRNAEPNQFPSLANFCVAKPLLRHAYRALLGTPGVRLVNNSSAGAASYARWLSLPVADVAVIANAVSRPSLSRRQIRAEYSIPTQAPLIIGIMRLSEEKQPLAFVAVIARLLQALPGIHALLVGDGPLRDAVADEVRHLGLEGCLVMAGLQDAVGDFIAAADMLLLTSRMEGMPNVAMEAQMLGKPVVATDVGGVRESLAPALHGLLCAYGDIAGMAERCLGLLRDPVGTSTLGRQAAAYMAEHRNEVELASNTLAACGRTPQAVAAMPGWGA